MLALPKAVSTVGVGVAVLLFALVSALTFKSTSIISRHASRVGARSYGDLISSEFGPKGALVLRLAIILHVGGEQAGGGQLACPPLPPALRPDREASRLALLPAGVVVVYLIIIADMLCGSAPEFAGVLPTLLGRHDGVWFLSRPFVVRVARGARAACTPS
jgi:amino acid permease